MDGGPGTGKTRVLLPKILEAFRRINPAVVFIKAAPTFVAAKQMGGITCQAAIFRTVHHRFENKVMILDEISMVNTNLLERMARWSIMGLKVVCFGDFSQLLPVGVDPATRWRMEDSRTFMKLCNNLRVLLTENRRASADWPHFQRVMSLRPRVDECPDACLSDFSRHYPWRGEPISYYVCISHRNRMRINQLQNRREMDQHRHKLFIPS